MPPDALAQQADAIEAALGEYATDRSESNSYTKTLLGSAVARCLAFVSPSM